jgi:hypothetical protein
MTFPAFASLNEEECPVPEAVFRQVRGAEPPHALMIAGTLPQAQRARLAVFCYRKRHLHELGLMIASTCDCASLVGAAGTGGRVIFEQSRDPAKTLAQERRPTGHSGSRTITLASGVGYGD